jgi:universal stress protein E
MAVGRTRGKLLSVDGPDIMKQPASILVVIDRGESVAEYLAKAVGLARQCGARIELFLCEAEQAYILAHRYDREGVEKARAECVAAARAYLLELKGRLHVPDVEISVAAECESPLYEGIVRQVLRSHPDLVIKRAAVMDPNDWQLMRTCPATLMLSRGRSWCAPARFAAAVDVSEGETAGMPESVLEAARVLAREWGAGLDVIYGATTTPTRTYPDELRRLCEAKSIASERAHVLYGDPESTLPAFAAEQNFDVLILGALAHRPASSVTVGALTSKLVDALDCDFVLVKPARYRSPVGKRWERAQAADPNEAQAPAE